MRKPFTSILEKIKNILIFEIDEKSAATKQRVLFI